MRNMDAFVGDDFGTLTLERTSSQLRDVDATVGPII